MSMPTKQAVFLPFLKCLADRQPHQVRDVCIQLEQHFQLSPAECVKNGPNPFHSFVGNAINHLKAAQLIERVTKGSITITSRGLKVIRENHEKIDTDFLRKYPEYCAVLNAKKATPTDAVSASTDGGGDSTKTLATPEELIESQVATIRHKLADELRDWIFDKSPVFFERLVVRLLVKMGYGGSLKDAGESIGGSGDGGIDGIIKEDKLGLGVIYIQAKRWKDGKPVRLPDVQSFVGALAGRGAKKGVFITTSTFTDNAKNYQPQSDTKIVLIDGEQLFQLMIDYNLGVTTVNNYEIKRIDSDFFEDD